MPDWAPSEDHWSALALARFILAMVVTNGHVAYGHLSSLEQQRPVGALAIALGGHTAVVGFMLISGYSIAHSVRRSDGFYGRRVGRVWPIAVLALGLHASVLSMTGIPVAALPLMANLLLLNSFMLPSFLPVSWSLACEALYYVAAPVIALRPALTAGLALMSALIYAIGTGPYSEALHGIAAAVMFWSWAGGFLIYRYGLPGAVPVFGIGLAVLDRCHCQGGPLWPVTWLATWSVVAFGGRIRLTASVRSVCNFLGDLSYPVFLLHWPILAVCRTWKIQNWWEVTLCYLLVSVLALLLVDRPLRSRIGAWRGFHGIEAAAPHLLTGVAILCLLSLLI